MNMDPRAAPGPGGLLKPGGTFPLGPGQEASRRPRVPSVPGLGLQRWILHWPAPKGPWAPWLDRPSGASA